MTLTKAEKDFIFWQLLLWSVMKNPVKRWGESSKVMERNYIVPDEEPLE